MLVLFPAPAVLCLVLAQTLPAAPARPSEHPTASPAAQAYYQFMLGGHFESEGELDRAMAAYREAARLDPESAEIRAELAGFFARQGRVDDASREARAALALDPANHEANRILGSILASLAEPGSGGRRERSGLRAKRRCISSAAAAAMAPTPIRRSDLVLARLYIRSRQHEKAITLLQDLLEREVDSRGVPAAGRGVERRRKCRRGGAGARGRRAGEPSPAALARPRCTRVSSDGPTPLPRMSARPRSRRSRQR